MAFRTPQLDSMTGVGAGTTNNNSQFGSDQFWNVQFNINARKNIPDPTAGARKNIPVVGLPQQNKPRKMGFFDVSGEDDSETSQYLNQAVFRPEKEMAHSQSPSQMFGAIPILPRNVGANQFPPRNNPGHITPTSINPNFPMNMQPQQPQQHSPNSLAAIGPRTVLGQNPTQQQAIGNLQKRTTLPSAFGSAGPVTSIANNFGFPGSRQGENHLSLDLNEFPSLSNRSNLAPNPVPTPRSYGLVSKPVQEQTPEFNITAEEFPALPGSTNPPASAANDSGRKTVSALFGPPNPYMPAPGGGAFDPSANKDIKNGEKSTQPKRGIQTHPDGTVSNIPSGMVTDQFGIVGLLTFIRAAENDQNLVALAPGIDLTTLGLNLNSPEYVRNLYSTFQSPWADAPCRPQDIDFHVPAEYLTNIFIRDKLAPIKLNRYGEDLLFFLFYMNGGDVLQLAAAAELYNREWRYHKEERIWMTRAPGMEPLMKTNAYERGTYFYFDVQNWRKMAKEFLLEYDKLEDRPTLPPTLHHNPNQPMVGH